MTIELDELKAIFERLIATRDKFEISKDHYWEIWEDELYNVYKKPENLTIGQLTDDWNELQRINDSEEPVSYDLVRFARIMRAIGQSDA